MADRSGRTGGWARIIVVSAAAVAAAALIVTLIAVHRDRTPVEGGPLRPIPRHGFAVDDRPGQTMTDALEVLEVRGNQPATITGVSVVGGGAALKYLGALIAGPKRRTGETTDFPSYPPRASSIRGTYRRAVGVVMQPFSRTHQKGYELLIGYRFISDQAARRSAIRIFYRVGSVDYVYTDPAALVTCPAGTSLARCGP